MNNMVDSIRKLLLASGLLFTAVNSVMAAPKIEVDRSEVQMGKLYVQPDSIPTSFPASLDDVVIKNLGDEVLVVHSITLSNAGTIWDGFSIQPGLSKTISATPSMPILGIQSWVMEINSNDPDFAKIQIPMSYEGIMQPPLLVEDLDGTSFVSGETVFQFGPTVFDPNRDFPTTLPKEMNRFIRVRNSGEAPMPVRVNAWLAGHGVNVVGLSDIGVFPLGTNTTMFIPPLGTLDLSVSLSPLSIGNVKSKIVLSSFWHPHPLVRQPSFHFFVETVASGIPRFALVNEAGNWNPEDVSPLDFEMRHLGEWQDSSVTIRNDGKSPLAVSAEIAGENQDDFVLIGSFPVTIPPGDSKEVSVRFAPKDGGPRSSMLRFSTDDPDQEQFDLLIRGEGFRLVVEDPEGSDFGEVPVGGLASRTFAIRNKGKTAISGITAELTSSATGQLSLTGDIPYSLAPGERSEITVHFSPEQVGSVLSYLKVTTLENLSKPLLLGITATGGQAPDLVVSSERGQVSTPGVTSMDVPYDSVDIGDYKRFAFDLKNQGTVPLNLSANFAFGSSADFSLLAPVPTSMAPGVNFRFEITFRPTDSGSKLAAFRIQSNDPDQPEFTILLSGSGFPFSVETPDGTEFDSTEVGESEILSFVLVNNGSTPLEEMSALFVDGSVRATASGVSAVVAVGSTEFSLVSPVPGHIDAKQRVNFQVRFKPASAGNRGVVLRLQSSNNNKQFLDIPLKAKGTALKAPDIVVKNSKGKNLTNGSASVGFGRVRVGSKVTRWFSIRNKEATPLHISRISVTGPHAEIFRITGASNKEIPPGRSLRFEVSCKPVKARDFSATFIIRSEYGNKKVPAIRVKGKGVALPSKGIAGSSGKPKADRVGE